MNATGQKTHHVAKVCLLWLITVNQVERNKAFLH
jgi:hypothetical protein